MSENGVRDAADRKRRVQRLKKLIIFTLFTLILVPYIFCAVLLSRLYELNRKVDELGAQIADIRQTIGQLQSARAEAELSGRAEEAAEEVADGEKNAVSDTDIQSVQLSAEGTPVDETAEQEPAGHRVYLTFDDGPSNNTDEILDILAEYDVKATFFVVGKEDEASQKAIKRIVEEGHTLGMHSYTHKYHDLYASLEAFEEDLEKERAYLYDLTGVESCFYRFPGGSSNKVSRLDMHLFADYLDSCGIVFYDWNVSSGDGGAQLLEPEELVKNCTAGLENWNTAVILLHDSAVKPTTVEALPTIIEKILAMEDTVILPITEDTALVQHIRKDE